MPGSKATHMVEVLSAFLNLDKNSYQELNEKVAAFIKGGDGGGNHVLHLQDFLGMHIKDAYEWTTMIGLIDAAELIVQDAEQNGNIILKEGVAKHIRKMMEAATLFGDMDEYITKLKALEGVPGIESIKVHGRASNIDSELKSMDPQRKSGNTDKPYPLQQYMIRGNFNPDRKSPESWLSLISDTLIGKDKTWDRTKNLKPAGMYQANKVVGLEKPGLGTIAIEFHKDDGRNKDSDWYVFVKFQVDEGKEYSLPKNLLDRARNAVSGLTVKEVESMLSYIKSDLLKVIEDSPDRVVGHKQKKY